MLPNVTHRLETNRIKTVTALVTGAFQLTACGSSPDTTVTTEYYRFANQPQDNDVPDAELDNMVLHLHADSFSPPVEAFLVPDEAQLDLPEGWTRIRPNIVMITDPDNAPDGIEGQRPDYAGGSEDFTLERSSSSET